MNPGPSQPSIIPHAFYKSVHLESRRSTALFMYFCVPYLCRAELNLGQRLNGFVKTGQKTYFCSIAAINCWA